MQTWCVLRTVSAHHCHQRNYIHDLNFLSGNGMVWPSIIEASQLPERRLVHRFSVFSQNILVWVSLNFHMWFMLVFYGNFLFVVELNHIACGMLEIFTSLYVMKSGMNGTENMGIGTYISMCITKNVIMVSGWFLPRISKKELIERKKISIVLEISICFYP